MKKNRFLVITLIVALSTMASTGYAQLRFGLRGEVGLNKATFSKDALDVENLNTFKIGPTLEFMFPMDFGVEASLLYNNSKMDVEYLSETEGRVRQDIEATNHYLDIPINIKYKYGLMLPIKIYAAAGPYARIHIAGDDIKFSDVTEDIKAKSFEAGINLGLGLELFRKLAVGVNYGIPLTDNYSVSKPEWKDAFNNKDGLWSIQATVYL